VPIHDDIRTLDPAAFRGVDLVCGGFPCTDISAAGKGAGIGGARSGLWFEMARIIAGVRPRWCLIENVSALRTRGADRVLADLESLGYDAWPLVVGAWAVGAPHRRNRVWIVARRLDNAAEPRLTGDAGRESARSLRDEARREESAGSRCEGADGGRELADARCDASEQRGRTESGADAARAGGVCAHLLHAEQPRLEGLRADAGQPTQPEPRYSSPRWPARPGEAQHEWEEPRLVAYATVEPDGRPGLARQDTDSRSPEQPMGSPTPGLPARLVRARRRNNREALKAYGNAICWPVAEAVLKAMIGARGRS
jgi:site-specific DNA-cytosine methylase